MPAMTATEMIPAVGQQVSVRFEELLIDCVVADVKQSWGKTRLQITPLLGTGTQWIELSRLVGPVVYRAQERPNLNA